METSALREEFAIFRDKLASVIAAFSFVRSGGKRKRRVCCNPAGNQTFTHLKWSPSSGNLAIAIEEPGDICICGTKKGPINKDTLTCHFQCFKSFHSQLILDRCLVLHFNLAELTRQHVVLRCAKSLEAETFAFAVLMRALRCFIEHCFRCKLILSTAVKIGCVFTEELYCATFIKRRNFTSPFQPSRILCKLQIPKGHKLF